MTEKSPEAKTKRKTNQKNVDFTLKFVSWELFACFGSTHAAFLTVGSIARFETVNNEERQKRKEKMITFGCVIMNFNFHTRSVNGIIKLVCMLCYSILQLYLLLGVMCVFFFFFFFCVCVCTVHMVLMLAWHDFYGTIWRWNHVLSVYLTLFLATARVYLFAFIQFFTVFVFLFLFLSHFFSFCKSPILLNSLFCFMFNAYKQLSG